jgi:hypothetical protein
MGNRRPFVIFALPRCRTAWLSHFLSYGTHLCGHDIGIECRSVSDFLIPFANGMQGTAETGSMLAWQQIRDLMPGTKFVVIKRPIWQVMHSLLRFGLAPPVQELIDRDDLLDVISEQKDTMTLPFDYLSTEVGCKDIFEFCLEEPFDQEWWRLLNGINIQVQMPGRIAQLQQNAGHLAVLKESLRDTNFKCPGNA